MMSSVSNLTCLGLVVVLGLAACGDDKGDSDGMVNTSVATGIASITNDPTIATTGQGETLSGGTTTGPSSDSDPMTTQAEGGTAPKFDLGETPVTTTDPESGDVDCAVDPMQEGCQCSIPEHVACDNGTQDPFNAMGLNCPGELQVNATKNGDNGAFGVRSNFGQAGTFNAREGAQYTVIGSGLVADLNMVTPNGDSDLGPTHCNDMLDGSPDPGASLPAPIQIQKVNGDCTQDPGLVGSGDCSGTVQGQFTQGGGAFDYTELRFVLQVPPGVVSFSYDFAFFSVEYPAYFGSQYNDMYIGWLESEKWTGYSTEKNAKS